VLTRRQLLRGGVAAGLAVGAVGVLADAPAGAAPRLRDGLANPTGIHPFRVRFSGEIFQAPRSWAQLGYPTLMYYNKPARGGHFAAWEEPQLFTEELRAAFRSLR
jgi:hypothetical protein